MSPKHIKNPILPGFNPDPSIVRVGDDFYIATSTFEWYPGVQVHHSRDLKHWRLVSRPLNRAALLDMTGEPDSCGVWAPCLTWADGVFWLVYTDVKRFDGNFKDTHNYLTTCESIDGEWSDPIYLNSSGFDPSLFHDDDGRKWLTNMVWDHRADRTFFGGIMLQEYDTSSGKLVGSPQNIFKGSELGFTEGPHIYKRDGYYYLLTAEGGTGYNHAMTLARSRSLSGPYELDPNGHFITAKDNPDLPLQRCGHGSVVDTPDGRDHYAVHLCSRPFSPQDRHSPMGRETAIQRVHWDEQGWLRLDNEEGVPETSVQAPDLPEQPWPIPATDFDFEQSELPSAFQWLRTPRHERLFSFTDRSGYLRLFGRESLGSHYESSLVALRQDSLNCEASTIVEFEPESFQQMAGLVCYYNSQKFHYLYISHDEEKGKQLAIMSCHAEQGLEASFPVEPIALKPGCQVHLKAVVRRAELTFSYRYDDREWIELPVALDYRYLSCEAGKGEGASFTGTFIGMACQDLTGTARAADFGHFSYRRES
ncbi:glycoside hydrolase family 43 protein [Gilvimarinus sp. SDUM040013]|uniref:Glycoside hydrolase family 43 protein n=1 Tax=Gilvimarinus gilvus TaxID=3058038 RepID=A0ABU4S5J6_9GAMM|nr:glycoside hydrolase family 43 protein [Gilvimarinus sp. SDUM040013]MDO3385898.1 glycoside hydrolase family 43 protein [Gilvimarinus sp. SDUM040013]MDX6850599.1 glycoside hydrolase family 43 protein [Gilvimarinus sp. SDUM040013]